MSRRPLTDERLLQKVVRIGHLMDIYGALLTDKQREFMRLHYEEDLSFGEIAADHGVSRQAIHDAVKHAERSLEDYESRLGLLAKGRRGGESAGSAEAAEILEAAIKRVKSAGVIYSADWIVAEMRRAIDAMRGAGSPEEPEPAEEAV